MSYLPADDKARKGLPLFKQITRYFPKALREITKVSVVNNVRYNPDREPTNINWNRPLSTDQLGSLFRHLLEYEVDGKVFDLVPSDVAKKTGITQVYVLAEAAWRSLAALELEIEKQEASALVEKSTKLPQTTGFPAPFPLQNVYDDSTGSGVDISAGHAQAGRPPTKPAKPASLPNAYDDSARPSMQAEYLKGVSDRWCLNP